MKKAILLSCMGILVAFTLFAQAPQMFNYQGVARDASGAVLADQPISILIRINIGGAVGPPVYTETHDVTTNDFGLFTLKIGTGTVTSGVFANIDWGADVYYLEVHMDASGGDTYQLMGTSQLISVPYALYAGNSDNSHWIKVGDDLYYSGGSVGLGTSSPGEQLELTGNLRIPENADSLGGVIRKGEIRYLHDYGPAGSLRHNIFLGMNAGNFSMYTDGLLNHASDNIGIGYTVLKNNTTGYENVGIGSKSLLENTSGTGNTASGFLTLTDNTTGDYNTAIGRSALSYNSEGSYNTAVGSHALFHNSDGDYNIAVGRSAADRNITGNNNVAVGTRALYSNYYGSDNVVLGYHAGMGPGSAPINMNRNVIVGAEAGNDLINGADDNILIGYRSGYAVTSGTGNILIGNNASPPAITSSSRLNIGDVIYGDLVTGDIGLGIESPLGNLHIDGGYGDANLVISAGNYPTLTLSEGSTSINGYCFTIGPSEGLLHLYGQSGDTKYGPHLTVSQTSTNVGIGESLPFNTLDVGGEVVIGAGYTGGTNAPENGLLVEGDVGVGTDAPSAKLHVVGPAATGQLATSQYGVYGSHATSGAYGYLGGTNVGGFGYSSALYGLWGSTLNGRGVYGSATGTGYSGYFEGKSYFDGYVGVGETAPNRALYVSELVSGLSYPLKVENKHTVPSEAAVGILFSTGGSGTNERGKGGLVYEYTSTWNRGSFHFLQNSVANSGNPDLNNAVMTITNNGNVGINETDPDARLQITANAGPHLIIHDGNFSNDRPGIQFTNNNIHFIAGDDASDEQFGFYSAYSSTRTYDTKLCVFGSAAGSWGTFLGLKHDGSDGIIDTDVGDIILSPASGTVHVEGEITTTTKTEYLFVPPSAFIPREYGYNILNYGFEIISYQNEAYFTAPVYLPDDATVVSVTAWWKDVSSDPGSLYLKTRQPTASLGTTMASMSTSWNSTSILTTTDNTISSATIDNQNSIYYFDLILQNAIDFRGVRIEYTYDGI